MENGLDRIAAFVRRHHVATLATVGADGGPWVAHVFYAWMKGGEGAGAFVFTTGVATRHGGEMAAGGRVAAGIALETRVVGRVQGLQVEGTVRRAGVALSDVAGAGELSRASAGEFSRAGADELSRVRKAYLRRFPYAVVADLELWLLEPTLMKLTDNTLGFGKKIIWTR